MAIIVPEFGIYTNKPNTYSTYIPFYSNFHERINCVGPLNSPKRLAKYVVILLRTFYVFV